MNCTSTFLAGEIKDISLVSLEITQTIRGNFCLLTAEI